MCLHSQAHRITANASLRGKQAPVQLCRQLDVAQHRQSHITWRQRPHGMRAHSPHLKSHTPIGNVTHHSSNAILLSSSSMPSGRGKSSIHRGTKKAAVLATTPAMQSSTVALPSRVPCGRGKPSIQGSSKREAGPHVSPFCIYRNCIEAHL